MSLRPSIYSTIEIASSGGRTADIRLGTVSVDYYEDILCPTISVKLQIVDAGGNFKASGGGESLALYDGMKLRGGEKVFIRIEPNSSANIPLDFTQDGLYLRGIKNIMRDGDKEIFEMHLISREATDNEISFLKKSYEGSKRISDHVTDILNEFFPEARGIDVDPTANPLGFNGNQMHPFQMITSLASKSVSGDGINGSSAGYFFFQTKTGFKFKSIDSLIAQTEVPEYFYTERNYTPATFKPSPNLPSLAQKIVSYEVLRNNDLIDNLKKGAYSTEKRFFDPSNFLVTTSKRGGAKFGLEQYASKIKNLGDLFNPDTAKLIDSALSFMEQPSRIITQNIDRGTNEKGVSLKENQEIEKIYAQRSMRYNTLFTQVISIIVPLNSNIEAGSIIKINVPKITSDSRIENETEQISGLYMVKEMCHHFDPKGSWTSMTVVRDSYGATKPNV